MTYVSHTILANQIKIKSKIVKTSDTIQNKHLKGMKLKHKKKYEGWIKVFTYKIDCLSDFHKEKWKLNNKLNM